MHQTVHLWFRLCATVTLNHVECLVSNKGEKDQRASVRYRDASTNIVSFARNTNKDSVIYFNCLRTEHSTTLLVTCKPSHLSQVILRMCHVQQQGMPTFIFQSRLSIVQEIIYRKVLLINLSFIFFPFIKLLKCSTFQLCCDPEQGLHPVELIPVLLLSILSSVVQQCFFLLTVIKKQLNLTIKRKLPKFRKMILNHFQTNIQYTVQLL